MKIRPFAEQVEYIKREMIEFYLEKLTPEQRKRFHELFPYDLIPANKLGTAGDLIIRTLNKERE